VFFSDKLQVSVSLTQWLRYDDVMLVQKFFPHYTNPLLGIFQTIYLLDKKKQMNNTILNQYGITFNKQSNGNIKINANSRSLDCYLYMLTRQKEMLQELITTLNMALIGNSISPDDKEWSVELGLQIYTGVIQSNMTFDLFLEDHYDQTLETFPLSDIREIFNSLLEFID
jgi:hypothetical protein